MAKQDYTWKQYFSDYWKLLEGRRGKFGIYTFIKSISDAIPFLVAFLLGATIDFFIGYSAGDSLTPFYIFTSLIAGLGGLQIWLRFYGKNGLQIIAANLRKEVRITSMSKLMDLELTWHGKEETGSKIEKINNGSEQIYNGIRRFSNEGVSILVGLFGALLIFLFLDIKYLLFGLVFITIYFYGEYYFNKKIELWQVKLDKIREKVSGKMHESASNLLTVKSLGLKDSFKKSTSDYEKRFYKVWEKTRAVNQMKFKTIKIFSAVVYGLFIFMVGFDVITGAITAGSILVFSSYFSKLKIATDSITNNSTDFIKVKSAMGRFMTIFRIEILDEEKDKIKIPKDWKEIEFKELTFKYGNRNVLDKFNLKIKRGDQIGVVGRSGCGKSTLTKLLLRLYHPQKGKILIDGVDLREYKHKSITDTLGIVLQEPEMFNTSLLKNITISSPKQDIDKFKKVIKIAQLQGVLKKLPKGINTLLGEKGYHLSGGERQRVGIARAIYKETPLLILDEATSALDSKTENLIQEALEKSLKDRTLLVIAHRLSTLKKTGRIIFMQGGKVVEEGIYEDLLKKKGKFYHLWMEQKGWKRRK